MKKFLFTILLACLAVAGMSQTYEYKFNPFTNQMDWVRSDTNVGSVWGKLDGNAYYTAGNVGVNTTTPGFTLDVNGGLGIRSLPELLNADTFLVIRNDSVGYLVPDFSNSPWTGSDDIVYVESGDSVGIGTSSPSCELEVNGDLEADNGSFSTMLLSGLTHKARDTILAISNDTIYTMIPPWMTDPLTTAGDLPYYGAAGTTRLAAGSEGQVLTMGATYPEWAAASGGGDTSYFDLTGTYLSTKSAVTRVGIGTASPAYELDVNGSIQLGNTGGNTGSLVLTHDNGGNLTLTIDAYDRLAIKDMAGGLYFGNNNSYTGISPSLGALDEAQFRPRQSVNTGFGGSHLIPQIVVDGSGKLSATSTGIGIGTTSPAYELDVVGDINASGMVAASDSLCIGAFRFIVFSDTLCSITGTDTLRIHPAR